MQMPEPSGPESRAKPAPRRRWSRGLSRSSILAVVRIWRRLARMLGREWVEMSAVALIDREVT